MKKTLLIFLSSIILLVFSSCDDYLDKNPDSRTELNSVDKIKELLVSGYSDAAHSFFTYAMGDNLSYKNDVGMYMDQNSRGYKWEDMIDEMQDTPANYWNRTYYAISNINHALAYIYENHTHDGKVDLEYLPYYGEALVLRAYNHFMLVNIFAQHYDPATNETELGIPYVTKPEKEVFVTYKRETLAKTYELILKDFEEGIKYIDDSAYDVPAYHFNKAAANAFGSRLYLYIGKWEKVIEYCNKVLTANPRNQLRDWVYDYSSINLNEVGAIYNKATEQANLLLVSKLSGAFNYYFAITEYGLTQELVDKLYEDSFCGARYNFMTAQYGDQNYLVQKWGPYFKRLDSSSDLGYYYVMFPAIEIEEVLFNRAEAYAMLGKDEQAIEDLNYYLPTRIYSEEPIATAENLKAFYEDSEYQLNPFYNSEIKNRPLLNAIIDMRRREFIYTGLRWFDIKRFNLKIVHIDKEDVELVLNEKDPRKAIQIPDCATQYGIKPNKR